MDIHVPVTTSPTAITGLAAGTTYIGQAQGHQPITYTTVVGAYDNSPGFVAQPGSSFLMKPESGESVYVWVARGQGHMVYTEQS